MRVVHLLLFLTLVLMGSIGAGAPNARTTIKDSSLTTTPVFRDEKSSALEDNSPSSFWGIYLGYTSGPILDRNDFLHEPYLSFRFMPLVEKLPSWDYQLDLNKDNYLGIAVGKRWVCCADDPYWPYLRLSGNFILKSSEEIASLLKYERWRLRFSAGAGQKYTTEIGIGFAITGIDLYFQWGYFF